ncbi:MAG TPA: cupin domain-containing protein [Reyranella sp.]|nr:cupin domain-containing protein [Reyranella sp.]
MTQAKFTVVHPAQQRIRWVGGQRQAVIVGGPETGGRYALSHSTIAVGGGAAQHRHSNEAESFYVIAGTIRFSIAGRAVLLGKGSFLHAEPGQDYSFEVVGDETCEVLIMYAPAGLERLIEAAGLPDAPGAERRSIDEARGLMEAAAPYGVHYAAIAKP